MQINGSILHQIQVYISHNNVRMTNGSPKSHKDANKTKIKAGILTVLKK